MWKICLRKANNTNYSGQHPMNELTPKMRKQRFTQRYTDKNQHKVQNLSCLHYVNVIVWFSMSSVSSEEGD